MPRTFADMILEPSLTLGTGIYELQGAAIGYRAFSAAYVTGDQPYYVVRNSLDTKFEINRGGTYTFAGGTGTLTRNVLYSSNSNSPVLWQIDDHPLAVYCPRSADSDEGNINGWLSPIRNALIRFGLWWKKDAPAVGTNLLSVYDGTVDIPFVHMNTATHVLTLDGALGGASIVASATPPATPHTSQLWFNSNEASLYVWYNDGNTTQWVPAMPIPAPGQPQRIKRTRFNSNGTFTPDVDCLYGYVTGKGGGAGGASVGVASANTYGTSSGGEGNTVIKHFVRADVLPTVAVTIGAGGAANAVGGDTRFGTLLTAKGGAAIIDWTTPGPAVTVGNIGDEIIYGVTGGTGMLGTPSTMWSWGASGGGAGGAPGTLTSSSYKYGSNGTPNSGGGGGGACATAVDGSIVGGTGGSGYLTVVEHLKPVA